MMVMNDGGGGGGSVTIGAPDAAASGSGWSRVELAVIHRALDDPGALSHVVPVLSEVVWATAAVAWIWEQIARSYDETGEAPSFDALTAEAAGAPDKDGVRETLPATLEALVATPPTASVRSDARRLRARSLKTATLVTIQRVVDRFDHGQDDQAMATLRRTAEIDATSAPAPAAKPLVPKTLKRPIDPRRIPTGLWRLDQVIDGVGKRELNLLIGTTGAGKSSVCTTFSYSAVGERWRTLYIDTENGEQVVLNRHLARFTGIPYRALEQDLLSPEQRERLAGWHERNWSRLADLLRVLYIGYLEQTVAGVASSIERTIREGFTPDLIVFDSADHLVKPGGRDVRWEQFAELSQHMKALAQRFNVAMWITSQAGSQWEGRVAPPKAVADAYQKARDASVVLSINAVPRPGSPAPSNGNDATAAVAGRQHHVDPRFAELVGEQDLLIYIGKNRNRPARMLFELESDLSIMKLKAPPYSEWSPRPPVVMGGTRDLAADADAMTKKAGGRGV